MLRVVTHNLPSDAVQKAAPQRRARRDLAIIGLFVFAAVVVILLDPDRAFEWLASHRAAQLDEFTTMIAVLGLGFTVFSFRRWSDLSRQVDEYRRLQTELSALHRDSALMSETDDLLQSCLTTQEAYGVATRHFEIQFPQMSGAIFSLTRTHDLAEWAAGWGAAPLPAASFGISGCWALRRGRVNHSHAADAKLACSHLGEPVPDYAMCVPMMAQGETIGTLCLRSNPGEKPPAQDLTEAQQRTVKTVAEHLGLAIANLNLRETLRTQSIRDPLTGLYNRRYMEEALNREFRRAARKSLPMAILMIDLDHFKRLNDTFGHEAGDSVLRELAGIFQAQLRSEDTASRYGGEEFTLILFETNLTAARECAERLRLAVRSMRISHYGQTIENVTMSAGIACFPDHGATAEALMRAADAALYRAKQGGRDRFQEADRV